MVLFGLTASTKLISTIKTVRPVWFLNTKNSGDILQVRQQRSFLSSADESEGSIRSDYRQWIRQRLPFIHTIFQKSINEEMFYNVIYHSYQFELPYVNSIEHGMFITFGQIFTREFHE